MIITPSVRPATPTRRALLRATAGVTMAALTTRWAAAAEAGKDAGTFKFIVLNDIHYVDAKCGQWLAKAITGMNAHGAELCLIVGDLTEDGTRQQNAGVRDVLGGLKMPYYCVVGNHDHEAGNNGRKAFEAAFPHSENYLVEHRGYQFLGLDSTQGRAGKDTVVAKATLDWNAAALKTLDRKRPTVVFTHFPLGWFTPSRPANAGDLLDQYANHNLRAVFNGHFHGATARNHAQAVITTNTCCSFRRKNHDPFDARKGYFLCTAKDGNVTREYVEIPPA